MKSNASKHSPKRASSTLSTHPVQRPFLNKSTVAATLAAQSASRPSAARSYYLSFILMFLPLSVVNAQDGTESLSLLARQLEQQNDQIRFTTGPLQLSDDFGPFLGDIEEGLIVATVLQLKTPLTREIRAKLDRIGVALESFLGGTTYLAAFTAGIASKDSVNSVFEQVVAGVQKLRPPEKVRRGAGQPLEFSDQLDEEAERSEVTLSVKFLRAVEAETARQELEQNDLEVLNQLDAHTWVVRGGPEDAAKIADSELVIVVDSGPAPFLPLNYSARVVVRSDHVQRFLHGGPSYEGFTGKGVRVGIADNGIDHNHEDFATTNPAGSRVYNQRVGSGRHGTHVASIVAGNGVNSQPANLPPFSLRGHAPEAEVGDYETMRASVSNYYESINVHGTDVTNHSYVQSENGYGVVAEGLDRIVRGDADHDGEIVPMRPQVWAAGNNGVNRRYGNESGYYSVFTSAKNTISVGSVDTRDSRVSSFSSLGPTLDGRIKPDVMAPGCGDSMSDPAAGIRAALRGTQDYEERCGTSMAAPVVSGVIALMMEAYQYGLDGDGEQTLLPSTYKAILVNTAVDQVKTARYDEREFENPDTGAPLSYFAGPDFATGFGIVDAYRAVSTIANGGLWRESVIDSTGDTDTFCVRVGEGAVEIKATLAWDDEPGSLLTRVSSTKLVNDLDLELVAPDGAVVRPWTLEPPPIAEQDGQRDPIAPDDIVAADRGRDRRNNVEMANEMSPIAGEWKIVVRGFHLPYAKQQPYSLVSTLPLERCS